MKEMNSVSPELGQILDAIHEDILIADGKGKVLRVSKTFEKEYGIAATKAEGLYVYQLEKEGYFRPSITAKVIETKNQVTLLQKNQIGRDIIVTGTPVFGESGEIQYIISFSRDITEMIQLQEEHKKLEQKVKKYTAEITRLRKGLLSTNQVISKSIKMEKLIEMINRVAEFDANILLLGPSGVGKTMFAKIIHENSQRGKGPFVEINCAAIPESLLESELFGYEKGSFTGANEEGKIGLIELAEGGTLLLDEISEMPITIQAKLLRTIQDKVITRVGGTQNIKVNFRLVTASNRNLEEFSTEGKFRKDLFYRLNVINIEIPPLKERREDIIPLAEHFLERANKEYGLEKTFHPKTIEAMANYSWPGNVREVGNVVERMSMTCEGDVITKEALPKDLKKSAPIVVGENMETNDLEKTLEQMEGIIIREAYKKEKTTIGVAKALNISQPTAHRKIVKHIKNKKQPEPTA